MAFGEPLRHLVSVDSTNSEAMHWVKGSPPAPEGAVVWADEQTAGRGRWGREWLSVPGRSLLFSVVLRPAFAPEYLGLLTIAAGIACAQGIENETGVKTKIKWPNDVLVNGRKLAGILSESLVSASGVEAIVVGIGINIDWPVNELPEEIAERATSLATEMDGQAPAAQGLLKAVLTSFEELYPSVGNENERSLLDAALKLCETIGREVVVRWPSGDTSKGKALSIARDGRLEVLVGDEVIRVDVAEVENVREG